MLTIIMFSVDETKPSETLLDPPEYVSAVHRLRDRKPAIVERWSTSLALNVRTQLASFAARLAPVETGLAANSCVEFRPA